jgi:putative ABC transport system ATP-binding protein
MALLTLKNVHKTYTMGATKVQAVRGIDMEIQEGDFACVVGPSGSGKTTLLNMIGCLDKPSDGELWFLNDQELGTVSDREATKIRRSSIGFIFQNFNLLPVLDIRENVELPLIMLGIDAKTRHQAADELIEAVGLADSINHRPAELSGGQQQRVAIARALISNPKLVLADEPTANLDSQTSIQILDLMEKMNKERKTTFIFSTHDPLVMGRAHKRIHILDGLVQKIELNNK